MVYHLLLRKWHSVEYQIHSKFTKNFAPYVLWCLKRWSIRLFICFLFFLIKTCRKKLRLLLVLRCGFSFILYRQWKDQLDFSCFCFSLGNNVYAVLRNLFFQLPRNTQTSLLDFSLVKSRVKFRSCRHGSMQTSLLHYAFFFQFGKIVYMTSQEMSCKIKNRKQSSSS